MNMRDIKRDNCANGKGNTTMNECRSMRLLFHDGYSISELSLMFMLCETSVGKHINGECCCGNNVPTKDEEMYLGEFQRKGGKK